MKVIFFSYHVESTYSSRYPIELNRWHQCLIEIYGQKLSLILNQELPVISYELFSSHLLWPRSFTYFGHLPKQYQSNNPSIFDGFRGAIQKVTYNVLFLFLFYSIIDYSQ